jgi:hypothetical protein
MKYTKYHGLGNDYILIPPTEVDGDLDPRKVQLICDRNSVIFNLYRLHASAGFRKSQRTPGQMRVVHESMQSNFSGIWLQ